MYICYCILSSYLYTLKMMVVGYILWCTYTELDCSLQDPTCYMTENTCNDTSIMFFNIHQSIRTHIPAKKNMHALYIGIIFLGSQAMTFVYRLGYTAAFTRQDFRTI